MSVMHEFPGRRPSPWRFARRFAARWLLVFVAVVLLAVVEGLLLWSGGFRYHAASAFHHVWASDLALDSRGDHAAVLVTFQQHAKAEQLWTDIVLLDVNRQEAQRLGVREFTPGCVALAPAADAVVFASKSGPVYSVALSEGTVKPVTAAALFAEPSGPEITHLQFSPDGKFLAGVSPASVFVWAWPGGRRLHCHPHRGGAGAAIQFSPDGKIICSPRGRWGLCLWDVHSGRVVEPLGLDGPDVRSAVWSFEAHRLVTVAAGGGLMVSDPGYSQEVRQVSIAAATAKAAFSPDGRLLASVSADHHTPGVRLLDVDSGQELGRVNAPGALVKGLRFAPDGQLFAWDLAGNILAWDVERQTAAWAFSLCNRSSRLD